MKKLSTNVQKLLLSKGFLIIDPSYESILTSDKQRENLAECAALSHSFGSLGYALDKKGLDKLSLICSDDLNIFYRNSIDLLKESVGYDVNTNTVFYKDFPNLDNISSIQRIVDAYLHYLTVAIKDILDVDNVYVPTQENPRLKFNEYVINKTLTVLNLKDKHDYDFFILVLKDFVLNSLYARRAIPVSQRETVLDTYLFLTENSLINIDENQITFNENKIFYIKLVMEKNKVLTFTELIKDNFNIKFECMTSFTDYLRLYRALSQDDTLNNFSSTLTDMIMYKSEPRFMRRWFLDKLNNLAINLNPRQIEDDLGRHNVEWIYVLENLHPGDYSQKYSAFYKYANSLRNSKLLTENHYIEKYFQNGDTEKLLKCLEKNPGEFARRLDAMLRNEQLDPFLIVSNCSKILKNVSLAVLVQLYNHFSRIQLSDNDDRIFVIKTDRGEKIHVESDTRKPLDSQLLLGVMNKIKHLIYNYDRPKLVEALKDKKVFVNNSLQKYTLPENDRLVSKSIKSVPFGSRIHLDPQTRNVVRLFTHWKNISNDWSGRVDIDLSAHLISSDFQYLQEISWRSVGCFDRKTDGIEFSGDITDAPNGANEFIDVNLTTIKSQHADARYIVICNNVFTGQSYSEIPECFSGVMFRGNDGNTGKIFDARTVQTKFNLCQEGSSGNIAVVLDLENMELICIDKAAHYCSSARVAGSNNLYLTSMVKRAVAPSLSLFDLISNSLKNSNIEMVLDKEHADYIISDTDDANLAPWNQEEISALFL